MKKITLLTVVIATLLSYKTQAQFAYGEKWYQNPLGFEPLKLHTSMGFILPAAAVGGCLLLTQKDPSLKQRLSVYNEVGLSWGYKYLHTFLPQHNTGINYQLRKYLSVGVEFDLVLAQDDFNSTTGFALRPFARFYPIYRESWKLYFESGGGFIYTLTEFPQPTDQDDRLGLKLNGITKYGLGSEIRVSKKTNLLCGVRHIHISNGNAKGVERNPSHDSNGFFLGLSRGL